MIAGSKGLFVAFLSATAGLMPMQGNTQPPVRIIVYATDALLEKLESSTADGWLAEIRRRCGCRVESLRPAPGNAWVLELPDRPDDARLTAFLDCVREQEGIKDAERDRMLQPMRGNP